MSLEVEDLARRIAAAASGRSRFIVAVAGPPGSGKSTLADALAARLVAAGERAVVLPMDGFHLDNGLLEEAGLLARKGAPETFDVRGLRDILAAVRGAEEDVLVPVFDRSREIAIASARRIARDDRIIIAEGNYLLLDRAPWSGLRPLFDETVLLVEPIEELERRLLARWNGFGYPEETIRAKVYGNDLVNARLVLEESAAPTLGSSAR
ncbi:nucleoside triphosphate hydrolase [Gellertiella hungarica]|uniref:Pantothenate kinase n=1 Tax=Gellertiella hungarica TaxID=1572859 RepID=A0A7W6J4T8_9HYPH|nr:nucleoside triphosphate hydrolase [Gellertiella hungarica]MBB4063876.1 pantothenate kinase [Gellertiella hungarica]